MCARFEKRLFALQSGQVEKISRSNFRWQQMSISFTQYNNEQIQQSINFMENNTMVFFRYMWKIGFRKKVCSEMIIVNMRIISRKKGQFSIIHTVKPELTTTCLKRPPFCGPILNFYYIDDLNNGHHYFRASKVVVV